MLTTHGIITEMNREVPEEIATIALHPDARISCDCPVTITEQDFIQMVKLQKKCEEVRDVKIVMDA